MLETVTAEAVDEDLPFGEPPVLPAGRDERRDIGVLFAQLADEDPGALAAFVRIATEVAAGCGAYVERRGLRGVQCVFGAAAAPVADAVLGAGRALRRRLAQELPAAERFSIGISLEPAVAGFSRATSRFERLIARGPAGDARRMSDEAWRSGLTLVAAERALGRASADEALRWAPAAPGRVREADAG